MKLLFVQVTLGSLAIVLGLAVGGASGGSTAAGMGTAGAYEALRLVLVSTMLVLHHRRENIAKP